MKPSWKDAPKWANWLAPKSNLAEWIWFENQPIWSMGLWEWQSDGKRELASRDHRLFLEKRPPE